MTDKGEDFVLFNYRNEADVRNGLEAYAHALGWHVKAEYQLPGWGRIDLLLINPDTDVHHLVELKMSLARPHEARRAYQQLDGYAKAFAAWADIDLGQSWLVGVELDSAAIAQPKRIYREISAMGLSSFCTYILIEANGNDWFMDQALSRARDADERHAKAKALHDYCLRRLAITAYDDEDDA